MVRVEAQSEYDFVHVTEIINISLLKVIDIASFSVDERFAIVVEIKVAILEYQIQLSALIKQEERVVKFGVYSFQIVNAPRIQVVTVRIVVDWFIYDAKYRKVYMNHLTGNKDRSFLNRFDAYH